MRDETFEPKTNEDLIVDDDSDSEFSDVTSEGDDDEDEDIRNESLFDRIAALKDIIPANDRINISRRASTAYSWTSSILGVGGKAVWILVTSAMLLGVPFALALEEERQYIEYEREMSKAGQVTDVMAFLLYMKSGLMNRCLLLGHNSNNSSLLSRPVCSGIVYRRAFSPLAYCTDINSPVDIFWNFNIRSDAYHTLS